MPVQLSKDSIDLGIVVQDIDAALAFYRDTLGFTPAGDNPVPGAGHMWRLMCGSSMIKLLRFERAPNGHAPSGAIGTSTGYRYWTISVSNLEAIVQDCEAAGYKVAVPVTEAMPGVTIAIVEDPEGNSVEFLRRT